MALTRHGHHIPGSGEDISPPASVARCGGPMLCLDCQKDCMNHREPPAPPALEKHDEATLEKVRRVLDNVGSISYTGTEIITMLQNEGILFRERG